MATKQITAKNTPEAANHLPPAWEKVKVLSVVVASLAVPVVLALLGNFWTKAQKQDELGVRYVELAVGILKTEPNE